jgi:glutathione-specific gamma-glutamylcyclotransferase
MGCATRYGRSGTRALRELNMWIFGYGSLIWDKSWPTKNGCRRQEIAKLRGYQRVFNKASSKNWGTKICPCPTLNVEEVPGGTCVGVAFEFDDSKRNEVLAYLCSREGPGFELREGVEIWFNGTPERAVVPICIDKALLIPDRLENRAATASAARGKEGTCVAYVENIVNALAAIQVNDPVVTDFWAAVCAKP